MYSRSVLVIVLFISRAWAFNNGAPNASSGTSAVYDENRRELLKGMLLSSAAAVVPLPVNAADGTRQQTTSGVGDLQLRDYHTPSLPNWQGTSLPGPLSLSETYSQIYNMNHDNLALNMGRWPDPILRCSASPIPASVFQNKDKLNQLQMVARALKNTARNEGAVGLAAQQCGVDASLLFIDGVSNDSNDMPASRRGNGILIEPLDGIFGQSSWRKSRREVSGEGTYYDVSIIKALPRKNNRQTPQKDDGIFLVNPRIIHRSEESEMLVWTEECLVLPPEFRATLLRDMEVTIEYESLESLDDSSSKLGETKQIKLQGELARCAQHEMDHDRGTLIVDHVSLDELLTIEGNTFMADIENTDGMHQRRMDRAYSRYLSESTLLPSKDTHLALAMEDNLGYHTRVKQVKSGSGYVYEDRKRPWFVQSANAAESESTSLTNNGQGNKPTVPVHSSACDEDCLLERKRIIEQRRAMLQQSRSNTRRADVLELSKQRASMYQTEYKGLPPQYCSRPEFCP